MSGLKVKGGSISVLLSNLIKRYNETGKDIVRDLYQKALVITYLKSILEHYIEESISIDEETLQESFELYAKYQEYNRYFILAKESLHASEHAQTLYKYCPFLKDKTNYIAELHKRLDKNMGKIVTIAIVRGLVEKEVLKGILEEA